MTAVSDGQRVSENEVRFPAADGFELTGTLLLPDKPHAAVFISAATGFPREFYLPFARFGAMRGAACLVYDYRGVGASAPDDLGTFKMDSGC